MLKNKFSILMLITLLSTSCTTNEKVPQEVQDAQNRNNVLKMSTPELEYRFYINLKPNEFSIRSEEFRFADKFIADELSNRGTDVKRLLQIKEFANLGRTIDHILKVKSKVYGSIDKIPVDIISSELPKFYSKTTNSFSCWHNATGYNRIKYDIYQYKMSWKFEEYGKLMDTFAIVNLYFKHGYNKLTDKYDKLTYSGLATKYRLVSSCGKVNNIHKPTGCRTRPQRRTRRRTPTYCKSASAR